MFERRAKEELDAVEALAEELGYDIKHYNDWMPIDDYIDTGTIDKSYASQHDLWTEVVPLVGHYQEFSVDYHQNSARDVFTVWWPGKDADPVASAKHLHLPKWMIPEYVKEYLIREFNNVHHGFEEMFMARLVSQETGEEVDNEEEYWTYSEDDATRSLRWILNQLAEEQAELEAGQVGEMI
jgi:hypothetical protein